MLGVLVFRNSWLLLAPEFDVKYSKQDTEV